MHVTRRTTGITYVTSLKHVANMDIVDMAIKVDNVVVKKTVTSPQGLDRLLLPGVEVLGTT